MSRDRFLLSFAATVAVALFLGRGDAYSAEPPAEPPFDFDRVINVVVVSGEIKQCDIPAGTDPVASC